MRTSPGLLADETARRKRALRAAVLAARAGRPTGSDDLALLAGLRTLRELDAASTVAAYHAVGSEPPTAALLRLLLARPVTVLLPVLEADGSLDWAYYDGATRPGPRGVPEPTGTRLGRAGVAAADVVVVPALAVDRSGIRLGRGGGSYDRALTQVADRALVVALLYADEYVESLPAHPHDVAVHAVVTPRLVLQVRPGKSRRQYGV